MRKADLKVVSTSDDNGNGATFRLRFCFKYQNAQFRIYWNIVKCDELDTKDQTERVEAPRQVD